MTLLSFVRIPFCASVLATASLPASAVTCEALARLTLPATSISKAERMAAGSFAPPAGATIPDLPALCRVTGSIKPSSDSDIGFEVWLPSESWNGKFEGFGNVGFGGSIPFAQMAVAIRAGYATAASDTGHRAGQADAGWGKHPEKVVDFGYRAVHETADKAKALVSAFYATGPRRAYFNSCSAGGRQALMEAQRYPADYDGIIAGDPANYYTHLFSGVIWDVQALAEPGAYIPPSKLPAIQAATLAACGAADGIIDRPDRCRFDPGMLLCKGAESDVCLTPRQVTTLSKLYSGAVNSKDEQIFPGHLPGAENGPGGWISIIGPNLESSANYVAATNVFRNLVYNDPGWNFYSADLDRDVKLADEKLGRILNATDPDLTKFNERGGKLILYHGWNDPSISALNTISYYRDIVSKMGAKQADGFVRLFLVPGMLHCGGGPGPNSFGQAGVADGPPQDNLASALENWVDQGVAPERIVAKGGGQTRPLCAYPQVAKYNGTGNAEDASSFSCTVPH